MFFSGSASSRTYNTDHIVYTEIRERTGAPPSRRFELHVHMVTGEDLVVSRAPDKSILRYALPFDIEYPEPRPEDEIPF